MDQLLKEMERFQDLTSAFTLADVAIVLALSFVLSVAIAYVYRMTHRGTSYSQTYAQTLVLLGMIVAIIMLIIGSNLARAFSLVGALSIVRFRNAVKETRDVGFVFFVMAIGMACGTRFYALAAFATGALSSAALVMYKLDFFAKRVGERILRVRLSAEEDPEALFADVFEKFLVDHRMIATETVAGGVLQETVYTVVLKDDKAGQALLEAVREKNGNQKVSLVVGQQEVDL